MTDRFRALPRARHVAEPEGFAETTVPLYAGRRRFGTMLVHETRQDQDWSVVLAPTSLRLPSLTLADVAGFVRAQFPDLEGHDEEVLAQARPVATLFVDGTHRTYALGSERGRGWFLGALERMEPSEWFGRIDVHRGRGRTAVGGTLWLESGGPFNRGRATVGIGRYGRAWSPDLLTWLAGRHADHPPVDPAEAAGLLQTTMDRVTSTRAVDGERAVRDFHLRRFPVPVRARGRAVVSRDGFDAAVLRMQRGLWSPVVAVAKSGHQGTAPARHVVLYVPLTADARAYPRSINRVPVSLVRSPMPLSL